MAEYLEENQFQTNTFCQAQKRQSRHLADVSLPVSGSKSSVSNIHFWIYTSSALFGMMRGPQNPPETCPTFRSADARDTRHAATILKERHVRTCIWGAGVPQVRAILCFSHTLWGPEDQQHDA